MRPAGMNPAPPGEIEFNPQFQRALDWMEGSSRSLFITGRAGTGKSTLLRYFREHTRKKAVFLAPTGVAAVNIRGQTLHSFFGFKPDVTPASVRKKRGGGRKGLFREMETVVIDEVSMVRADLLDCVDRFLRLNGPAEDRPFGGVQMIFIGDLYQLAPVVTSGERDLFRTHYESPYFFSARSLKEAEFTVVELEKVYRQTDETFLRILNAIRNRTVTDQDLSVLNRRCDPGFEPPEEDLYIHLTSTNEQAEAINRGRLDRLKGQTWAATGVVEGDFGRESFPAPVDLRLKRGAQIMLLNNDPYGRWINGTLGRVTGFSKDEEGRDLIQASLDEGGRAQIRPYTWDIFRFSLKDGQLVSEAVGSFTQYPVRPAFAVTIHKSQGKTFSRAVIDVGRGTFAHGQMYVALSRCTALEGIVLKKPLTRSQILMDWRIVRFLTGRQYAQAEGEIPREEKLRRLQEAVSGGKTLEIVYLKAKDEKTRRRIRPLSVGERSYRGRPFLGLEAFCLLRSENRVFNLEKILEIRDV